MLRVAVVGVGSMGKNHARIFHELETAELVAVVDADPACAREIGERFQVPAYTDCERMFAEQRPEAVSIAVPTIYHETTAALALSHGAHILVEKPLAATLEEAERLIDMAARADRQLMVGQILRFNAAYQAVKAKLDAGELGRVFQIITRRMGPYPARIRDVGVVLDLAAHDVDLMRFLLQESPVDQWAELGWNIHDEYEDLLLGVLTFPSGARGAIETNWLSPKRIREVMVLGERGMYYIDEAKQTIEFYSNGTDYHVDGGTRRFRGVSEGPVERYEVAYQEPLKAELAAFIDSIERGVAVPVTGEDGLEAMRSVYALLSSGQSSRLKSAPLSAAY